MQRVITTTLHQIQNTATVMTTQEDTPYPTEEDASRRREEWEALRAVYGEEHVQTPNNNNADNSDEGEIKGPWMIQVTPHYKLELELPAGYPSLEAPIPKLSNFRGRRNSSTDIEALIQEMEDMWSQDTEVAILWVEHCRSVLLSDESEENAEEVGEPGEKTRQDEHNKPSESNSSSSDAVFACLSTHHLLDHKPDNLLRTGHKYQLNGFYKFGTPGVALAWGEMHNLENFMDALKSNMPQKKFFWIFQRPWTCLTEGEIPQGWNFVEEASSLKDALLRLPGVSEEDYFAALGIEKRLGNSDKNGKDSKVTKDGKGKKKKR